MSPKEGKLLSSRIPCEFFLIRYVPDVVKGEFTNIGVVLREARPETLKYPDAARKAVTQVRFTRDWRRVRCIDPGADTELLESIEDEIASRLISEATGPLPPRPLLQLLSDTLSNSVQITEPRATLAESFALELEQLLRLYVEPIRVRVTRERTGRAAIHAEMRKEFERAGVWAAMFKRYPVSEYTRKGDPMRLDCGYRPEPKTKPKTEPKTEPKLEPKTEPKLGGGTVHIFHAISLAGDAEAARGLAFTAPLLRQGLERKLGAGLDLAAVVEPIRSVSPEKGEADDFTGEAADLYRFGVATMEGVGIRVLTTSDLPGAAATARTELRL
jgi:hypothetical protein